MVTRQELLGLRAVGLVGGGVALAVQDLVEAVVERRLLRERSRVVPPEDPFELTAADVAPQAMVGRTLGGDVAT